MAPFILLAAGISTRCSVEDAPKTKAALSYEISQNIKLTIKSGDGQEAVLEHVLSDELTVEAIDLTTLLPVSNLAVEFEVDSGEAYFDSSYQVSTDISGQASTLIRLGETPGPVVISAKLVDLFFLEDRHVVFFNLLSLNRIGPLLEIHDPLSNNQAAEVDTTLPIPLSVRAVGEAGEPMANERVNFLVTQGSSGVNIAPNTVTNSDGIATATLSLGTVAENIVVTAYWVVDGETSPKRTVAFNATAVAGPPAVLEFIQGNIIGGALPCVGENEDLPQSFVVQMTDAYQNPIRNRLIEIDPDLYLAVDSEALGAVKNFLTDTDGKIMFQTRSGVFSGDPGDPYSVLQRLWARVQYTSKTGAIVTLLDLATINVTQDRYVFFIPPIPVEVYGDTYSKLTGSYTTEHYLTIPMDILVVNKCSEPAVGAKIKILHSNKQNSCPHSSAAWSGDTIPTGSAQPTTNPQGRWIGGVDVLTWSHNYSSGVTYYARRLKISATNTPNELIVLAGPDLCR